MDDQSCACCGHTFTPKAVGNYCCKPCQDNNYPTNWKARNALHAGGFTTTALTHPSVVTQDTSRKVETIDTDLI